MEKKETKTEKTVQAPEKMTKEQALGIVTNVCNAFKGDLNEHTIIQQALQKLQE